MKDDGWWITLSMDDEKAEDNDGDDNDDTGLL